MDLSDNVAYSVHDLEDAVVAGRIDLSWLPAVAAARCGHGARLVPPRRLRRRGSTRPRRAVRDRCVAHGAVRREPLRAGRVNLTSDLIGGSARASTRRTRSTAPVHGPLRRRPGRAARDRAGGRLPSRGSPALFIDARRRPGLGDGHPACKVVADLVTALRDGPPGAVRSRPSAPTSRRPVPTRPGHRVVVDQVASLTDASALAWHTRLR